MYVKNVHIYLFLEQDMISTFLRVLQFPPPIKLSDRHDITEILLKVALNTITLTLTPIVLYFGTNRILKILLIAL